jgi:hypothetical protein
MSELYEPKNPREPDEPRDVLPEPPPRTRELPTAPYLDAIVSYGFRGSVRFHVPGHKGGPGADPGLRSAIGDRALALDICQDIEGIDVGPSPTPYERAEQLAAAAYGAQQRGFSPTAPRRAITRSAWRWPSPRTTCSYSATRMLRSSTASCSAAGWRASWHPSTTSSWEWPMA